MTAVRARCETKHVYVACFNRSWAKAIKTHRPDTSYFTQS